MPSNIVCLVGMPGAGKSTIAAGLAKCGYPVVSMGDAVRREAQRRGIGDDGPSLGRLMLQLRQEMGSQAVAQLVKPDIIKCDHTVIVDGIRSDEEVEELRSCGRLRLLAVHASADTRFCFLQRRHRSDDPDSMEKMQERDRREMGVGISNAIALADESISNNFLDRSALVEAALDAVRRWEN